MTLLFIGWKPRFADILPALGLETVVVLGDDERRMYGETARAYGTVIDLADKSDVGRLMLALTRFGYDESTIDCVYTDQETPMVAAALLASHYRARGISMPAAVMSKDKFVQKQALARAGIRVPDQRIVAGSEAERTAILRRTAYPAVLKPISAHGSRHVSIVRDADSAAAAIAAVGPYVPDAEVFVIEELIRGTEMHADGVVVDGDVIFVSASRYHRNVIEDRATAAIGSTVLDPEAEPDRIAAARELARATVTAMGLRDGAFHLEYFETPTGLVFSECGARSGGGWVTEAVLAKFGYDIRRAALQAVLGHQITERAAPVRASIGWSHLPVPPGRLLSLPSPRDLAALPGVVRAWVDASLVGTTGSVPRSCGRVVVEAGDPPAVRARIAAVAAWLARGTVIEAPADTAPFAFAMSRRAH